MNPSFESNVEDIGAAVAAGRAIRETGPYGVLIGNESLQFRPVVISDPVPTGRQILEACEVADLAEYLVFEFLPTGVLEEIRPDETTDLRAPKTERFLVFRSDRSFRFMLNDRAFDWGTSHISGATLKHLAGIDVLTNDVFQQFRGHGDVLIDDKQLVDLSSPGVERFVTVPVELHIVVNGKRKTVHKRQASYWEIVKLGFPDAVPVENIIYSIDYGHGPDANPEGSMVDGQVVQLKEGMTFYVTPTDKS